MISAKGVVNIFRGKGYCKQCKECHKNEIERLEGQLAELRQLVPLKERLKQIPYKYLVVIAKTEYGIPQRIIFDECDNKAELIDEILRAADELKKP